MLGLAVMATIGVANLKQMEMDRAELEFPQANEVVLRYAGKVVFKGHLIGGNAPRAEDLVRLEETDEAATPMYLGYPHGPKTADWVPLGTLKRSWTLVISDPHLKLQGVVQKSLDLRPCTTNLQSPLASAVGAGFPSFSDALYSRDKDWLLELDSAMKPSPTGIEFTSGTVTLRTDYYRNHLGYFLWDSKRKLWPKPVAGWCSWAAYGQDVTEGEVAQAAKFFGRELKDYGYDVIQIDDGYQRVLQLTDNHQPITEPFSDYWTKPNEKFPHGMASMAKVIDSFGMTPGIWIGLYLPLGLKHADAYVTDNTGKPLQGPWVGYSVDSGKPAAVKEAYTGTLKTFREQGWRYFKIDTLRHVLYDSYRRVPEYWASRETESSYAYRKLFQAVRQAVGKDNYLLACWGALPELAGLPDGCRIGEDVGPAFASMRKSAKYIAQFHYANDVVWRNDPDYMCFRIPLEQCQTWATLTSLTGEHVMVSDPVETYDPAKVDVLRRVGPPVVSKPVAAKSMAPDPEWVTLTGDQGGETWTVAAHMAWAPLEASSKPLTELGLASGTTYLAFDFWKSQFLGLVKDTAKFSSLAEGHCQVVGLRPLTGHPQVLGDDRHVSQGAYELDGVQWQGRTLKGKFRIGTGKAWSLYLYVPAGFTPVLQSGLSQVQEGVWKLTFPEGSGWKEWQVEFRA